MVSKRIIQDVTLLRVAQQPLLIIALSYFELLFTTHEWLAKDKKKRICQIKKKESVPKATLNPDVI